MADTRATALMLHTVPALPAALTRLAASVVPDLALVHLVDESLLTDTITAGRPTPQVRQRVYDYAQFAERSGFAGLLVTCSSIGEIAEEVDSRTRIPIMRIDGPMAQAAAAAGGRIGVLATLSSTLKPTTALVERAARQRGLTHPVCSKLVAGAFEAARAGDTSTHDRLVLAGLAELEADCDVVVLAQASMARVLEARPPTATRPKVLTSTETGIAQLHTLQDSRGQP